MYVVQCVSAVELGFALLTSHTFPPVTMGKYTLSPKCTVIQHASGCPGCTLNVCDAHTAQHLCALSSSQRVHLDYVQIALC